VNPAVGAALPIVLLAGVAAAVAAFVLTPLAIRLAPRLGAIDEPNEARRIHHRPVPRSGGLAVVVAFVGVGMAGLIANELFHFVPALRAVRMQQIAALFGGVAVGGLLGYLDDRLQLRARWQFAGQALLAALALLGGVVIDNMVNPLGGPPLRFDGAAAWAVTTVIAAVTLAVNSLFMPPIQPVVALLCALLAGSLIGFLPYNFHPARTFLGTGGVFAIGYALAVLSVIGTAKVAVALLVLGVPIIDTFWIIIRRLSERRSPFSPDRGHFHHRLLDLGLSHRQAVLLIYALGIVLAVLSMALSGQGQLSAFVIIVVAGGIALYLVTRRARLALDRRSYPEQAETEFLHDVREAVDLGAPADGDAGDRVSRAVAGSVHDRPAGEGGRT
jgi:UDP-GlcNAc:undecaprenyl-phosphate/decaprenyl-phosphate GlcNAc-1-phosphate transferase